MCLFRIATGYPFRYEAKNLKDLFLAHGKDPDQYYCLGESVLKKEYRGQGIGRKFLEMREGYIRGLDNYSAICFYTSLRSENDPRRPKDYHSPSTLWKRFGFVEHPELVGTVSYQEIGEDKETPKAMVFWIKEL